MKFIKLESYPYELKFRVPLQTAKGCYEYRRGTVIKLFINDMIGLGEVAPLEGFHKEELFECYYSLEAINQALQNITEITSEELFHIFKLHSDGKSSLLFGLETALFDVLSQQSKLSLNHYLNSQSINTIHLNGLHTVHQPSDNFKVVKVKLGYNNIYDDIEQMSGISSLYKQDVKFRIDVNEQLDLPRAIRFCKSMEKFNIEYIEQPLPKNELEDLSELRMHTEIPIALDESVCDLQSVNEIIEMQAADVFVIKPMVVGGYDEVQTIINLAKENDIKCVITNMLDGAINRMACIHIASANQITEACGLSADNLFASNLSYVTPKIINGSISISKLKGLGFSDD